MSLRRIVMGNPAAPKISQVPIHAGAKTQLSHSQDRTPLAACRVFIARRLEEAYLQEGICMTSGRILCTWPTGRGIRMSGDMDTKRKAEWRNWLTLHVIRRELKHRQSL